MPVTEALTRHLKSTDIIPAAGLVGGDWLDKASDGRTFEVTNPSTGEVLAVLPDMRSRRVRQSGARRRSR